MADLVLGLAKSAVEETLNAAKSAIEEEKKLKKNMQRDLMLISDEFEMMHSFLNVSRERASDEMVRTLVRQVRNMALDVEDCIESVVLVDMKFHWWSPLLGWLPSCSRTCMLAAPPPMDLDEAVTAIELLKSRVEAMGQRNERYMQIGDCGGPKLSEKTHQQTGADATAVGILIEAREAKKKNPRDLIQLINTKYHDLPLQVISLWGSAGDLGVASIIKKTCHDPEIIKKFRCRAWVKLTRPFNLHEFIRSLLIQFYTNYPLPQGNTEGFRKPADVMTASEAELVEEFMNRVRFQRYLVFLEDVSSAVDWEAVRVYLPNETTDSCVVVHSQQLEVASLCVGQSHKVLELEQFSPAHSVCVFFNEKKSISQGLIELIKKERQGISVVGPVGDLGLESIMKNACDNDPEICKKFTCRAWVQLMHPFDSQEFIQRLLKELHQNNCPQHSTDGIEFVKEVMSNQRFLLFLENVSSMDDLEATAELLPELDNGSCIIVHTKTLDLAKSCLGESHRELELQQFPTDRSVRIFFDESTDENVEMALKMEAAKQWIDKFKVVGRQVDIRSLSRMSGVVQAVKAVKAVYGIAGVGKSYIVKHVYYKHVIDCLGSFKKYGWVDVLHPFNLRDFSEQSQPKTLLIVSIASTSSRNYY